METSADVAGVYFMTVVSMENSIEIVDTNISMQDKIAVSMETSATLGG